MRTWSARILSSSGFLVVSMMAANVLNFLFNAYLGRALPFADFGLITLFNTFLLLLSIAAGALGSVVNYQTAFESARGHERTSSAFLRITRRRGLYMAGAVMALWVMAIPFVGRFFQIEGALTLLLFAPVIPMVVAAAMHKGFLQGHFYFVTVGIVLLLEAFTKLASAILLVRGGLGEHVILSLPISLFVASLGAWFFASRHIVATHDVRDERAYRFPFPFYIASLLSGFAGIAYLSFDVVLAKHFLEPKVAGEYALLSLVGKMIYFFGALLNGFMISFVANDEGAGRNPNKTFYRIFAGACSLTFVAYMALGIFGGVFVPFLLGERASAVLPYLPVYALAIALFTVSSAFASYHLARKHYLFPVVSLLMALLMSMGIWRSHDSIDSISRVILFSSSLSLGIMFALHLLLRNGKFILRAVIDLADLVTPLPNIPAATGEGKRILIFNWRDIKHAFAGGAEMHVHEFAKRWVRAGNSVTIFAGNDGASKREDVIDGVQVIRRGGFYFVYVWAFFYYVFRFRGTYDVIIDCQNGVPFFTPLYAKERVYSLLFHVHQEVFYHSLPRPFAAFAAFLENTVMPWAYRNVEFITTSDSSKRGMERFLGIDAARITVIHPGVNLDRLKPGEKSPCQSVLYLGRLKAYKSVDVLLRSFRYVLRKFPDAELVIAGRGEEERTLKQLAHELNIERNVKFKGGVTETEKIELLQRAWVFVNPSMMEGWGITTIEANACGVPVVASDVPGLRDSVRNPHTGFLVPHGDAKALAEKIVDLLHSREVRQKMEKEAVAWAQKFHWDAKANECLEVIYE